MLHLFVDTNVYLNFYHFTNDDIETIDRLISELNSGRVKLHLPQQVRDEWERNREAKLQAAAEEFKKASFQEQVPRHMHNLDLANAYRKAVKDAKDARNRLIAEASVKAKEYGLEVDVKLKSLFDAAEQYPHDLEILKLGRQRAELGNPPGKPGSLGDQYNWEVLLAKLPREDIYIVSKDGDFSSPIKGEDVNGSLAPNAFIKREWHDRKGKNIYVFDSIKKAMTYLARRTEVTPLNEEVVSTNQVYEPVLVSVTANRSMERESEMVACVASGSFAPIATPEQRAAKNEAIDGLVSSNSFSMTHNFIAKLNRCHHLFEPNDVSRMFEALVDNQQINWIVTDDDVNEFYIKLLNGFISAINPVLLDNVIELLGLQYDEEKFEEEG